ncbi:MAG: DUF1287 domain-containing protein [Actinomycetota bacterium]|nr:DUF1287 domain-containing protein [Actinomycetota bacterium]
MRPKSARGFRRTGPFIVLLVVAAVIVFVMVGFPGGRVLLGQLIVRVDPPPDTTSPKAHDFAAAAAKQVGVTVSYDASYVQLAYPGGDVPLETGVCTDVVVRAMREMGTDLQVEIHEDMAAAFGEYPRTWGLSEPDPNIDHRRVPNLRVYFDRLGKSLPVTSVAADYQPGDIVTWKMPGGRPHVGIVSEKQASGENRFAIIHNAGRGTRVEDVLVAFTITGHYRPF